MAKHTLSDELARIAHPQLRAVLDARWGDYGGAPGVAPFIEHALVTGSYDAGAYYPIGGSVRFAQTLLPAVRAAGVEVTQGGVTGNESALHVISDMGAVNTVNCLPEGAAPA